MTRERLKLKTERRGRLVMTRGHMQAVQIGDVKVTVIQERGETKLSIEAPKNVHILRSELEKHP